MMDDSYPMSMDEVAESAPEKVEGQFVVGDEVFYLAFHDDKVRQGVIRGVRWDEYAKTVVYEIYNGSYCEARHAFTAKTEDELKEKLTSVFDAE